MCGPNHNFTLSFVNAWRCEQATEKMLTQAAPAGLDVFFGFLWSWGMLRLCGGNLHRLGLSRSETCFFVGDMFESWILDCDLQCIIMIHNVSWGLTDRHVFGHMGSYWDVWHRWNTQPASPRSNMKQDDQDVLKILSRMSWFSFSSLVLNVICCCNWINWAFWSKTSENVNDRSFSCCRQNIGSFDLQKIAKVPQGATAFSRHSLHNTQDLRQRRQPCSLAALHLGLCTTLVRWLWMS